MSLRPRLFLISLALFPVAVAAAGEQPPRRGGYPDRQRGGGSAETRHAFSLHSGFRALDIESGLFEDNELDFGITDDDFLAARYGLEFDFAVLPALDIVVGFETGEADTIGSYVDFVYDDGGEIEHAAFLGITELTLGVRFQMPGQARFRPYLLAGVSGAIYRYREVGEFVDFTTSDIFYDEFSENSFHTGFFVGAGTDFAILRRHGRRIDLFGEFRYARSAAEHDDGFEEFGDLTVARTGGLFGIRFRF